MTDDKCKDSRDSKGGLEFRCQQETTRVHKGGLGGGGGLLHLSKNQHFAALPQVVNKTFVTFCLIFSLAVCGGVTNTDCRNLSI